MRYFAAVRRYFAIVLVYVVGIALSGSVFLLVRHWEDEQFKASLTDTIDEHVRAIRDDVDGTLEVPTYLRPFFAATLFEVRADVQAFLAEILDEEDEVEVLGWAPRIQEQERGTVEAWGQARVDPGFRIIERTPQGGVYPGSGASRVFPAGAHRGVGAVSSAT
jgi:CHASE1-domain containing sensor protein